MSRSRGNLSAQKGLTLIEVLITLVLISIGLLGMAAMQVRALQFNQSAYLYSQAISLSYDIADRMRINRQAAASGQYDLLIGAKTTDFTQLTLADQDKSEWLSLLETCLPEGDGQLTRAGSRFRITVCWDDSRGQGVQSSMAACGTAGRESYSLEVAL